MRRRLIQSFLTLSLMAPALTAGAQAAMVAPPAPSLSTYLSVADVQMTVSNNSGYANLRTKPTTSAKIVERLPQGTQVLVLDKTPDGKWVHVKAGDKQGYIKTSLLK